MDFILNAETEKKTPFIVKKDPIIGDWNATIVRCEEEPQKEEPQKEEPQKEEPQKESVVISPGPIPIPTGEKVFTEKEIKMYETYFGMGIAKHSNPKDEYAYECSTLVDCRICKETKPLTEFQNNTSGKQPFGCDGKRLKRKECKDCTKREKAGQIEAVKLAKSLGKPYKAPEGTLCEMCEATEKIVFDHCHDTKVFRGWLCDPCNRSLGVLGDNVPSLLKYTNYLQKVEKRKLVVNEDNTISILDSIYTPEIINM